MKETNLLHVESPPPFLPIFRSAAQARLLTRLYLTPERWRSLSELARESGLGVSGVHREIGRLQSAGLIEEERVGNTRRVRPDRSSRFFPELRTLLVKAFGPTEVLAAVLADVPGVEGAWVFGSWAAIAAGAASFTARGTGTVVPRAVTAHPGTAAVRVAAHDAAAANAGSPGDIDVIVIGTPDVDRVYTAARQAAEALGIDVQPMIVSRADWTAADPENPSREASSFLCDVRVGPMVEVRLDGPRPRIERSR